jgi:two-component system, cell cycle response regulator DivK
VTVLLVDDYPDALDVWDIFLTAAGCQVMTAGDGARALEVARSTRPDVIVMDLQMPGMSGPSLAKALRADAGTAQIPLIAVTGRRMDPAEARSLGFAALIVKPCEPEALLAEIRRVTERDAEPVRPAGC